MGIVIIGTFFIEHLPHSFLMNWFKNQSGEGFEFDILFRAIGKDWTTGRKWPGSEPDSYWLPTISRYRIIPTTPPGMAASDPFDGQPGTLEYTMLLQGLHSIMRTGWRITTLGTYPWRDD